MFRIEYKIIIEQPEELEYISDEEIRYNFLLGNVSLISSDAEIEMEWEWIPLLDFAYCLQMIVSSLKAKNTAKEYFEFTENAETLEFSRQGEQLKIVASFSSTVLETIFADFEKAVYDFHFSISEFVRTNTSGELPTVLQKYLLVEM
ncbi:hypothetical protein ACL9RF_13695 [Sphingobacterium sp. Mn56C]|uniref:hypothetical protein n=1 Tax=Bacteroidota TaxID=976 RepID=UPI002CDB716D|nr:hypothetical protein [Agriterribacter sp.]HTN08240.1 hypothetical protein [Agriterribacter sp.]HTN46606.1 hypothetical protein [Flavipsychrobacter sp.]